MTFALKSSFVWFADKSGGGNPYCPRPTPAWQKEIAGFLVKQKAPEEMQSSSASSSSEATDSSASCSSSSS